MAQLPSSWRDKREAAIAAFNAQMRSTPPGYYTANAGYVPVNWQDMMQRKIQADPNWMLNLGKPGVFADILANYTPGTPRKPPPINPALLQQLPGYISPTSPYAGTNGEPQSEPVGLQGSYQGSELGDFLTDITQGITAAATAYGNVSSAETNLQTAQLLSQRGISPVGYTANGVPIYQSTPAGVTPTVGGMVPSGMVLPAGVTPSYTYPVGFVSQPGASGVYQVQPPTTSIFGNLGNAGIALPLIIFGGGALLLIALMGGGK